MTGLMLGAGMVGLTMRPHWLIAAAGFALVCRLVLGA